MLKSLFLNLMLRFKGIRFYKTDVIPKSSEFRKALFETIAGIPITFFFYKEECEDLIFKNGKIKKEKFIGYLIQAKFDKRLSEDLQKYNNLKFFFNSNSMPVKDDEVITQTLLNIYLDFIKQELKNNGNEV